MNLNASRTFERIVAGNIKPGDKVARARTHTFQTVASVSPGATSVYIEYEHGNRDRPRKGAFWWREV